LLELKDVEAYYGNIRVLKGISLRVPAGAVVTLIWANGAGKTAALRAVAGAVKPRSGKILFEGRDITGLPGEETRPPEPGKNSRRSRK